jgi:hypothetical protein
VATAVLNKLCQQFGWSSFYHRDGEGYWSVEVRCGPGRDALVFASANASKDNTNKGKKEGHRAAAAVALKGLSHEVERERAIPTLPLKEACGTHFAKRVRIVESNDAAWSEFWSSPPTVVGVDVEGNGQSPPCLVQIATATTVIIEAPVSNAMEGGMRALSVNLQRLLADDTIVKVFCDSRTEADKKCLELTIPVDMTMGTVVDIECISAKRMGHGPSRDRGLARIFSEVYTLPKAGVRVSKPGGYSEVKRFTRIEKGWLPQLESVWELSKTELEYAALDAWITLLAWVHLTHDTSGAGHPPAPDWSIIDLSH